MQKTTCYCDRLFSISVGLVHERGQQPGSISGLFSVLLGLLRSRDPLVVDDETLGNASPTLIKRFFCLTAHTCRTERQWCISLPPVLVSNGLCHNLLEEGGGLIKTLSSFRTWGVWSIADRFCLSEATSSPRPTGPSRFWSSGIDPVLLQLVADWSLLAERRHLRVQCACLTTYHWITVTIPCREQKQTQELHRHTTTQRVHTKPSRWVELMRVSDRSPLWSLYKMQIHKTHHCLDSSHSVSASLWLFEELEPKVKDWI